MRAPLCFALAFACCLLSTARAEARRVVYAIMIGNNAAPLQSRALQPLRYADDDAAKLFELFGSGAQRSLLTVFDADTARRYPELAEQTRAPTYRNLQSETARVARAMQADRSRGDQPVLYLTFSGHGDVDSQGEPSLSLLDEPLTRARLYDDILVLLRDDEVHLIVDACRAAGVVGVRGAFDHELEGQTLALATAEGHSLLAATSLSRFPNLGALVASASGQETHEWSRIESGVFTHEILSGLRGAADVNGDLTIHYSELQAFVAAANRDISDPKARPSLLVHLPRRSSDPLLLDLRDLSGARMLHGNAGALGHFYVEQENGERLLDAHLSSDHRSVIALPSERRLFVRSGAREAELAPDRADVSFSALRLVRPSLAARGSVEHSFRDTLWKSAYGPTYYRGFMDSIGLPGVSFAQPAALPNQESRRLTPKRRLRLAFASSGIAAAALLSFGVSLWLTVDAKQQFDATRYERRAHDLRGDVRRRLTATLATGSLAALAGTGALVLWPRVSRDGHGGARAELEASLSF